MTQETVTNVRLGALVIGWLAVAGLLNLALGSGCGAVQTALDLAFLEPAAGLTQAETVGDAPLPGGGDFGSVDDVLRVACCFVADDQIQAQIDSLESQRLDGLNLVEALDLAFDNCADATDDGSFLRLCCLGCGAAVAEEVYGGEG